MPFDNIQTSKLNSLEIYFSSVGFSESEVKSITQCFQKRTFDKGEFFVSEGSYTSEIGYLEFGQFQFYSTNQQGDERTNYISLPNTFVASLLSYLTEKPSRENVKAINPSCLWVITKKDILSLQEEIASFKDFYIQLIEYQLCCIDKAKFDLITLTAEQRYKQLMQEEPEILQQVPLQYIASMLGMTPRHLSRLRAKI
nr:Crp/Fnr family transcriptional regulator [Aquimarina sp. U1-2]